MPPDFTLHTTVICKSNIDFAIDVPGSQGNLYKVRFCYQHSGPVQYDWECPCKGFQHRKTCRHIEVAKRSFCGWNADLSSLSNEAICPRCGGPTEIQKVAT